MAYLKQNFKDGDTLTANQLNNIENGVYAAVNSLQDFTAHIEGIFSETDGESTDLTSLFDFDFSTGVVFNGASETSSVFLTSTKVDISAFIGQRIKLSIPNFTSSSGSAPNFYNAILDVNGNVLEKVQIPKNPNSSTMKGILGEYEFIVPEGAVTLIAHMFNNNSTIDASTVKSTYEAGLIVYEGALNDFSAISTEIIITEISSEQEVTLTNPGVGYSLTYFDNDEICDYYAIINDGTYELADGFGCSSFIPCKGSSELAITLIQGKGLSKYGLAFYDENKKFINFIPGVESNSTSSILTKINIPSNAGFFKASYFDYETTKTYGQFKAYMFTNDMEYTNGKRPYQTEYIWFSKPVNQAITKFWETDANTVNIDSNFKSTTGVLTLPDSYSPGGKKTPLLLYCHGFSHYVYYGAWGANSTFLPQKKHWTDMGFAVMDVNGARNNNRKGNFQTGFCPQGLSALKQCVDYVIEHYNVDPQIYIVCGSAGGTSGWNYARVYPKDVRAMVAIATWSTIRKNCFNAQKSLYQEYLGFTGTTYEEDKTVGLDPYDTIININGADYAFAPTIPVLYVYGSADTGDFCADTLAFTTALRNAGLPAQIRMYEGLGHEIVSGANEIVDKEIGNWLLLH